MDILTNMSLIVDKKDLTDGQIAYLYKQAKVSKVKTAFMQFPKPIRLWGFDGKRFWFPMGLNLPGKSYHEYHNIPDTKVKFDVKLDLYDEYSDPSGLKRDQTRIYADALENLAHHGSAFLYLSTGFGKSIILTKIIQALRAKAAIFVFSSQLQKDIVKMLKANTNAKVFHYIGKKEPPMDTDIDVIGLKKGSALSPDFLSRYQTMVIDEVDQMPAEGSLPLMRRIAPKYLVGLTATLERSDGLHTALFKYWGDKKYYITRFVEKPDATLIKYQTNFMPVIEHDSEGKVKNDILANSIASNEDRHACIERLVRSLKGKKILILSDRTEEILALYERLKGESCDYKTGKKTNMDKNKRILIGGYKSCGRGYDVPGLDVVILLTSFRNVKQYEGRLRSECGYIYDFVDNAYIFESRWKTRLAWYRKRKMNIKFQIDGIDEIRDYKPKTQRAQYEEVDLI